MDSNEPIVEIAVDDMTQVPAMKYKDFAGFFNPFVSHTVKFLNRFACVCEEKLADLSLRMQRLEITISLLETKLSSIPGLEDVKIDTPDTAQYVSSNQKTESEPTQSLQSQPSATAQEIASEQEIEPAPEPEKPATKTVAEDPRYGKFFKMLKVGVPLVAIRGKVLAEGLNPDLLENPDAPIPDGDAAAGDDGDDDDSFSEGSSASSFSD